VCRFSALAFAENDSNGTLNVGKFGRVKVNPGAVSLITHQLRIRVHRLGNTRARTWP
jgi:hypothetical protein